jgi:hypothetical protein
MLAVVCQAVWRQAVWHQAVWRWVRLCPPLRAPPLAARSSGAGAGTLNKLRYQ